MPKTVVDAPEMMKAVSYSSYGGGAEGLQHVELLIPKPRKDELLVKVEACSINPLDWKVQKGFMKPVLPYRFPHVPDITGVVVKVGPGVTTFVPGDKVVSCLGKAGGGLAEYAVAPTSTTIKRRQGVSCIEGVALGVSAFAAVQSVRNFGGIDIDEGRSSKETKNLLIVAASGGVGTLALQIAKLGGAHVTASCSPHHFRLLQSLGADEVVDSRGGGGEVENAKTAASAPASPSGRKYDVVINCGPHQPFPFYKSQLAPSGFVIDLTPSPKGLLTSAVHTLRLSKQKYFPFVHLPNCADMYFLFYLLHRKKLRTVIDSTYPIAKAQDAWARCMEGHGGGERLSSKSAPPVQLPDRSCKHLAMEIGALTNFGFVKMTIFHTPKLEQDIRGIDFELRQSNGMPAFQRN